MQPDMYFRRSQEYAWVYKVPTADTSFVKVPCLFSYWLVVFLFSSICGYSWLIRVISYGKLRVGEIGRSIICYQEICLSGAKKMHLGLSSIRASRSQHR